MRDIRNITESALREGRIVLHFQPVYCVAKKNFPIAEVLARIEERDDLIYPNDFIGEAEKNGDIIEIGYYVLRKLGETVKNNPELSDLVFAVNVSPQQFMEADFAKKAIDTIKQSGLKTSSLIFEITGSADYDLCDVLVENVNELNDNGVAICLEDVGKGVSDLGKINGLPLSYISFDKYYINRIVGDGNAQSAVKNLIQFSNRQGIHTIAEGVETAEQVKMLCRFDSEFLQGFYYSKPLAAEELKKFLEIHGS